MKQLLCLLVLALACSTPDNTPPVVDSLRPPDGATGIARNTSIRAVFSKAMDRPSAEAALSISPAVAGAFTWPDDRTMLFTPSALLDSLTEYAVTLRAEAHDLTGRAINAELTNRFTTGATARSARIVMFGRSVLEAWFYHWGWDGQEATPVSRTRFELHHRNLVGPDGGGANTIADFRQQVSALSVADSPAVFFKLCFVDFAGGDSAEAQANLDRNSRLVDSLAAIVAGRGLRLIVGNALPVTESEHDAWRYWNHARYNAYLAALAQASPGRVLVLDLYNVLTNPVTRCILPAYRTGANDAHPNAAGYDALDPVLDELLEENF